MDILNLILTLVVASCLYVLRCLGARNIFPIITLSIIKLDF
jgi:hypothetical protein